MAYISFKQFLKESLNLTKIETLYAKYNKLAFNDELPIVPIRLSNNKRISKKSSPEALAVTTYVRDNVSKINSNIELVFKNVSFPEDLLIRILIHEMIHIKIASENKRDNAIHGTLFMQYLKQAETKVGFKIPVDIESKEFYDSLNSSDDIAEKEIAIFYMKTESKLKFFFFQMQHLNEMKTIFEAFIERLKISNSFSEYGFGTIKTRLYKQFPIIRSLPFKDGKINKTTIYEGALDIYYNINIIKSV